MSEPLVERLDRIAAVQHRTRSSLIQHVLWEYVHAHPNEARRK
jgi:predicted transcriptional regulator